MNNHKNHHHCLRLLGLQFVAYLSETLMGRNRNKSYSKFMKRVFGETTTTTTTTTTTVKMLLQYFCSGQREPSALKKQTLLLQTCKYKSVFTESCCCRSLHYVISFAAVFTFVNTRSNSGNNFKHSFPVNYPINTNKHSIRWIHEFVKQVCIYKKTEFVELAPDFIASEQKDAISA